MTAIQIIAVPYDSGLRAERMGRGPLRLLEEGLPARLAADGHEVSVTTLETTCGFRVEAAVGTDLLRQVSEAVRAAIARGARPLVVSGNCNTAVGALTGLGADTGLVWFDAHGEFNTPDTSPSGFFDGMGLAMATGRCWRTLAASITGFSPLPDERAILVGARDLDPGERELLESSHICRVPVDAIRAEGAAALDAPLRAFALRGVRRVHLHIDLDVHDPDEAPANSYGAPNGLTRAEVLAAVERIAARLPVAAAGLASYDPAVDPEGRTVAAAIALARAIASTSAPG